MKGMDGRREVMNRPYPLEVIPEILDAAKECGGDAYPLVAGLAYTGMRPHIFGLRVEDLDFERRIITVRVIGGRELAIPMDKRLIHIWKEHLETRGYDNPMLFRLGKCPYLTDTAEEGGAAVASNHRNVRRLLLRVEKKLRERGIEEHLTAHRFRVSTRKEGDR